jgi:hypothetical protein
VIALLRFWKPIAGFAIAGLIALLILNYGKARFTAGYQQATSENAEALEQWEKTYEALVEANELRIQQAGLAHEQELAQLAARYDKPRPRLVCRTASSSGAVPTAAGIPEAETAETGPLRGTAEEGFDPTFRLFQLAEEADYMLANCRHLNQAVHGVPSE